MESIYLIEYIKFIIFTYVENKLRLKLKLMHTSTILEYYVVIISPDVIISLIIIMNISLIYTSTKGVYITF